MANSAQKVAKSWSLFVQLKAKKDALLMNINPLFCGRCQKAAVIAISYSLLQNKIKSKRVFFFMKFRVTVAQKARQNFMALYLLNISNTASGEKYTLWAESAKFCGLFLARVCHLELFCFCSSQNSTRAPASAYNKSTGIH